MSRKRITQLDGLRALAFAAVFIHHAFWVNLLWAGVDVFFVLSGFLITGILIELRTLGMKSYFAAFYSRRVRRVLPAYVLFLVAASCLGITEWTHQWYLYVLPLMNYATVVRGVQVTWSLAVEEQFYVVWPFVIYYLHRHLGKISFLLVLTAPVLRYLFTYDFVASGGVFSFTPCRMDLLAAGALLCLLYRSRKDLVENYGHLAGAGFLLGGALVLLTLHHFHVARTDNSRIGNTFIYEATLLASVGVLLWALSGRYVGLLNLAPLRALGKISYSCYLIHYVLVLMLWDHMHTRLSGTILAFILTVAYATVSWFVLEKPILNSLKRKDPPRMELYPQGHSAD